ELESYSAIPLPGVERYCDQVVREFWEMREKYGIDAPNYGKPLEPQHPRILDRLIKNIQVLRKEPSVKEQGASYPLREYPVLSRLGRFEQEIHAFGETFLREETGDSPRPEQGGGDARAGT
ncbi:MAG: hypothetical protein LUQ62_05600, partial [Methanomicrobiales archaeon]|nr:hypothetical protein [Methanomicrobiales archaeon]